MTIRVVLHHIITKPFHDDALHVCMADKRVSRNGQMVSLPRAHRMILIALCANPGRHFSKDELLDIVYGEHLHGGPEKAMMVIKRAIYDLHIAAAALGIVISSGNQRGLSARAFEPEAAE